MISLTSISSSFPPFWNLNNFLSPNYEISLVIIKKRIRPLTFPMKHKSYPTRMVKRQFLPFSGWPRCQMYTAIARDIRSNMCCRLLNTHLPRTLYNWNSSTISAFSESIISAFLELISSYPSSTMDFIRQISIVILCDTMQ